MKSAKENIFFPFQFSINVLIMSETSLLQCSFGQHINSSCGYSVYYANEVQCVPLLTCKKPIRAHLMRLKLNGNDVAFEWQLILARAGIFNSDVASSCTVCPRHQYIVLYSVLKMEAPTDELLSASSLTVRMTSTYL